MDMSWLPGVLAGQHPAPKPTPKPTPKPGPKPLTPDQTSAYDLMRSTLNEWGLGTLAGDLRKLIAGGVTSSDLLRLQLSETDAYKQRFKGNEARKAAGLRELLPAEYVALENSYKHTLRAFGLPQGFKDGRDDLAKLIAGDVSPDEFTERLKVYHDQYEQAPQEVKDVWSQYFGKGDILAGLIDPTAAQSIIQDRAATAAIGGEAAKHGFSVSHGRATDLYHDGVTLDQARAAYSRIGETFGLDQSIAGRFGQQFTQADEENDLLLGDGEAANKRRGLYGQEQALFRGSGGLSTDALGVNPSL